MRGVRVASPPPPVWGSRGGKSPPQCSPFPPLLLLRCGDIEPHPGRMRFALANATSLRLHWHTVANWRADVVLISETRLTAVAQRVMRAQAGASGWQAFWGAPLESLGGGGASGMRQEGGVRILVRRGVPARQILLPKGVPRT